MGGLFDTGGEVGDGFVGLVGEKDGCLCSRARAVESPKTPAPTMSMGSRWAPHMASHVSKIGRRETTTTMLRYFRNVLLLLLLLPLLLLLLRFFPF
jgi:hypothetical protein